MSKVLILSTIILVFFSCTNQAEIENVKVPEKIVSYNTETLKEEEVEMESIAGDFKIYTLIDVSCATCLINIEKWDAFAHEKEANGLTVLPICYSKDNFELLKYLVESDKLGNVSIPLYLDTNNTFMHQNDSLISEHGKFTALTDTYGKILAKGDPTEDSDVKKKYLKLIIHESE
ncbi:MULTISPECIES: hypothetical protein [Leeuwenhoekiella]|uniref:hypothetical protein n=1 Tax=Leeuwenhoekiella TaxID=283735 RepID=UPI000C4A8E4E|nr:hypothetical protein [Leeuwenhoekiella blandensis]MBQ52663.1 hypothetical protein [Leeuwenhoekiella sp.]HCW63091.1 hypothetical protein [Leeuwenhoekiella sp.]|tara:strand:- start:308 stop:832 length:525 start_codon:yes stop_codon:yes gene_type:complete